MCAVGIFVHKMSWKPGFLARERPLKTASFYMLTIQLKASRGSVLSNVGGERATAFLSAINLDGPADVVLLLKRTGVLLAGWTRNSVAQDVISVMAATMIGSVDTLLEALGGESPPSMELEAGGYRVRATRADPQCTVVLIAPASVASHALQEESDQLVSVISRTSDVRDRERRTVEHQA